MAGETLITVVGNLTADPELRFTPSGSAVASGTIASTPRTFDRTTNEWKDGETLFVRYSAWRDQGENAAESLTKGQRVIAQGFLKPNNYETKEGEKRTGYELEVQEIGPSLKHSTAKVARSQRGGNGQGQQGAQGGFGGGQQGGYTNGAPQQPQQGAQGGWGGQQQAPAGQDPWATPQPQQGGYQQPQPAYGQQPQQGYAQPQQGQPPF